MQIITIGRESKNNIVLNDDFVSRQHAQLILLDNGQAMVKDVGSSNGTFVNGNRISECYLRIGDTVKCGNQIINWQSYLRPTESIPKNYESAIPKPEAKYQASQESQIRQEQSQIRQEQQFPQQGYNQQNVIIIGKQKSVGVAFILAFFFGPLGLLYASVTGGIIMFLVSIVVGILTLGFGLIFTQIACVIWAVIAANNANDEMLRKSVPLLQK